MISLVAVIREREFRVLALGELALHSRFFVDLHELCRVTEYRKLPAKFFEEFDVNRKRRKPLRSSHHMCRPHQMVVHDMREMVCRDTCPLENDCIHEVLGHVKYASDGIVDTDPASFSLAFFPGVLRADSVRLKSYDIRNSGFYSLFDLFICPIPASRVFPIDARHLFCRFLLFTDLTDLFLGQEARISLPFRNEFFCKALIDRSSFALCIGTVIADITCY